MTETTELFRSLVQSCSPCSPSAWSWPSQGEAACCASPATCRTPPAWSPTLLSSLGMSPIYTSAGLPSGHVGWSVASAPHRRSCFEEKYKYKYLWALKTCRGDARGRRWSDRGSLDENPKSLQSPRPDLPQQTWRPQLTSLKAINWRPPGSQEEESASGCVMSTLAERPRQHLQSKFSLNSSDASNTLVSGLLGAGGSKRWRSWSPSWKASRWSSPHRRLQDWGRRWGRALEEEKIKQLSLFNLPP